MAQHQEDNSSSPASIKYGELFVLGSNDHFTLYQRATANGVKPSTVHKDVCNAMQAMSMSMNQHSIVYKESAGSSVVVEYASDSDTDMFQIGRYFKQSPIDFVVHSDSISRFACRIICQRSPPYTAHIYAAGFNCSKSIFLGENAVKWNTVDGQRDGLTTNGVLVMHPPHGPMPMPMPMPILWREISVCGNVHTVRKSSRQQRGDSVDGESHELVDGSLIDLCGVTLQWRTAEGLALTPTVQHVEVQRQDIYAGRSCFAYKPAPTVQHVEVQCQEVLPCFAYKPQKDLCELTLDPNTAHKDLSLFEKNRMVACMLNNHVYPIHQDRFKDYRQVMCRESLTGLCYWEVEWSGWVEVAVTRRGIDREGDDSLFGRNDKSWCLKCYGDINYTACHNKEDTVPPVPPPSSSGRVGVSVDCAAGTVSFFTVSADTATHLHTFQSESAFTEPLYAGFSVLWDDSSVRVCQRESVQ